ncbi:MAG TPA: hypothetical protein VGO62_01890 [Myxococcota bacterium]|jgi:hypothetical protein
MRFLVVAVVVGALACVAGCTLGAPAVTSAGEGEGEGAGEGEGEGALAPGTPTYATDIQPLLAQHCTMCHQAGGIAPFPLTSYDDAFANKDAMADATGRRIMPPWYAAQGCTEYAPDQSLSDDEIALIANWFHAGAPEGDKSLEKDPAPPPLVSPEPDVVLAMSEPYTQQAEPDEYRCFPLAWTKDTASFITGFRVTPGTAAVVHHIIATIVPPSDVQALLDQDDADPGPGFTCGAGGGMASVLSSTGGMAFVWAPGADGERFPEGTGIAIEPGSYIQLQIHYNSSTAGAQPDQTTVGFATADTVAHPARFMPWMDPRWVVNMNIPAGESAVDFTFAADPTRFIGGPFTVFDVMMHMHNLGAGGDVKLLPKNHSDDCLLDLSSWSFHWQLSYPLAATRHVEVGDQLQIHCQFNNQGGGTDVHFGEGTADEMCLAFLYVTPDSP